LIIHGEEDTIVPPDAVHKLVERISIQKGVKIEVDVVPRANHFFADHLDELIARIGGYLDTALTAPDFDPLA
jgi:alpha/beta superfamily hydrolase